MFQFRYKIIVICNNAIIMKFMNIYVSVYLFTQIKISEKADIYSIKHTIEILSYKKKMRNTQEALDYLLMSHRHMKCFFFYFVVNGVTII